MSHVSQSVTKSDSTKSAKLVQFQLFIDEKVNGFESFELSDSDLQIRRDTSGDNRL